MFESDDFDQVLSQFDFPTEATHESETKQTANKQIAKTNYYGTNESCASKSCGTLETTYKTQGISNKSDKCSNNNVVDKTFALCNGKPKPVANVNGGNGCLSVVNMISPKHIKRKLINSHFDPKSKRKFPGPAGLLTGNLEQSKDDTICHMELLSQDVDFSQNNFRKDLFESPLWMRLLEDVKTWKLNESDTIKMIKQQALAGHLRRRKAQTVTAFVETVDRSAIDPLVILRDTTGSIKCTLHRDAWSTFSPYIVSEYCALILVKPTVLTTGSAFKKHYLNITLNNIYAIYSSAVLNDDEDRLLPDGYVKVAEEHYTLIKSEISPQNFGSILPSNENDLLEGLDASVFAEDLF